MSRTATVPNACPRMFATISLATVIGAGSGCYPAMAHPTRVGSGFSVITTLGMYVSEDQGLVPGAPPTQVRMHPTFGMNAALSIRDTSATEDGVGLRVSVGTGFAMPIWQAYVELPRDRFGPYDAGVGVAVHGARPRLVMPYAQFGRQVGERRVWWFTQQGIAFGSTSGSRSSGAIWVPTVAVASGAAGGEASLFLTGVVGGTGPLHEEICRVCVSGTRSVTRNYLLFGVSWGQIVISNLPIPRER
ncbi:MAG TPA: hypothetical protein VFD64_15580 [Gemmatimonadaceae bacterium]|nr:hypothetical protein [Gemmatimonadaceae bacterium]